MAASQPPSESVPVYDCHVLLTKPQDSGGMWTARCATAASVTADAATEREVLQKIASRFKFFVHEHRVRNEAIPWTNPPLSPAPNELQRWIAVHL